MLRAGLIALAILALPAAAAEVEDVSALPAGPGQEETFHGCIACHGTAIIRRSRFTRDEWNGLMDWMVERHGMNPLEAEERRVIVDYLARHFGPAPVVRARNPFLN